MKEEQVKYRYALNKNNELIEIHDAHRAGGEYYCPQCGDQMVCRCGTKNAWHFAHVKAKCNYDNYLHTIAEQRILEWFNNTNDISLVLQANEICERHNACVFYRKEICQKVINTKAFNLKQYYSSCEKEKHYEKNGQKYIADLLCYPVNEKNEPLFIEICVSHPCEKEKLDSGIRIIEFVIKSEEDIDKVMNQKIQKSNRVRLYNFQPKEKYSSANEFESLLQKFIIFSSKKGYVQTIHCSQLLNRRGEIEIAIPHIDCVPDFIGDGGLFSIGFAVASQHDRTLKHCCLCKYHVYDMLDGFGVCKLYKKYGTNRDSSDNDAQRCQYFRIDINSIQMRTKEFDDYCSRNPVDIWIKPK